MSHSCCAPALQEVEGKRKIVLAGNPNAGISVGLLGEEIYRGKASGFTEGVGPPPGFSLSWLMWLAVAAVLLLLVFLGLVMRKKHREV